MSGVRERSWLQTFWQQYKALLRKNALLAWRNRTATCLRIFAPFLFVLLVWLIDSAVRADREQTSRVRVVRDPTPTPVRQLPRCEDDKFISGDCFDFMYTVSVIDNSTAPGVARQQADEIVTRIRENNEPQLPQEKVRWFAGRDELDEWFLENQERSLGAVHFFFWGEGKKIDFTLQTNSSVKAFKGRFQHPNFFFQIPLQMAVEREIVRQHLINSNNEETAEKLKWDVGFTEFPHPAFSALSVVGVTLGPFIFAANMFGFVAQMSSMIMEKQSGMRQVLRTMGMLDSAYWASWATWEVLVIFTMTFLQMAFGAIFQFKFFLKNSFFLLFFLLFLFQLSMSGMGMLLSVLLPTTTWATIVGFVKFILGWIMQISVIIGLPYSAKYYDFGYSIPLVLFSLFPSNLFMKGVNDLGEATSNNESDGLSWSERTSYCLRVEGTRECEREEALNDGYVKCNCVLPVGDLFGVFFAIYVVYFVLAIYLENVIPNGMGVKNSPVYFLDPRYWGLTKMRRKPVRQIPYGGALASAMDQDVAEEQQRLKEHLRPGGNIVSSGDAVEVLGLQKKFGNFWSIKDSWFSIKEGQLFCLLGPNGAGKTTTINCLTGVLPPSGGDALICGESITQAGGMNRIRSLMGVCPQFDVLWDELTGREHLEIFGHIKGLSPKLVGQEAEALLGKVKLIPAAKQRSRTYSGGMKRRLSVAIALLGDPKIVYLDEPTTGMDPISRRYVWDIIESAKAGRAIVLTTHSMEEADILGDRISIMARGQIKAIGTSIRLKQKFGAGYEVSVAVGDLNNNNSSSSSADLQALQRSKEDSVKEFFRASFQLEPREENQAYLTYLIPRIQEKNLPIFLKELEAKQSQLSVTDIQLSLTTLEEVFLKIARDAEAEALKQEGRGVTNITFTDGVTVAIEAGQTEVARADLDVIYAIHWGQDESGRLLITDAIPQGDVALGTPELLQS